MAELKEFKLSEFDASEHVSKYIEASAGTGKTYTIQKLVRQLLEKNAGSPSLKGDKLARILIVTYTEKAAGELKDRIRKEIAGMNADRAKIGAKKIEADIDSAPIFTIHSFCQNTLEEFAFTAQKPSSLSLAGDGELQDFIDLYIRDVLEKDEKFKFLFKFGSESFIENLKKDMAAAIGKYYLDESGNEDENIVALSKGEHDISSFGDDFSFDEETTPYDIVFQCISEKPEFKEKLRELELLAEEKGEKVEEFKQDLEKNLSNSMMNFNGNSFQARRLEKYGEKVVEVFNYFRNEKNSFPDGYDYCFSVFCATHLNPLYLAWQAEKAARKIQTYDDMIRSVREAVCQKDSPLTRELRKKYDVAIIDEFQDTNQRQWDIFRKVFKDSPSHHLIVVGDPKQSIYAFQGADVNVYKNAVSEIGHEHGNNIRQNYRSTNEMIEACNLLFGEKDEFDAKAGGKIETDDGEASKIKFFSENDFDFTRSNVPADSKNQKRSAEFDGKNVEPFWIVGKIGKIGKIGNGENDETGEKETGEANEKEENVSSEDFARIAAEQIIECCTFDENGKTRLQIHDKEQSTDENKVLRSVSFKDFAVLARTSSEMEDIEYEMQRMGIPFTRYKDKNLFAGRECAHWISVLAAVSAPDFTGQNRKILSEALFSPFFGVALENVTDERYDSPICDEREVLFEWHELSVKRQWAKLIESIFERSGIEERLSKLENLQSLSKYRQIGNYMADYLYKNDCTVDDAKKHLQRLHAYSESAEDDGNLVERGTDFDSVQVMTIHASKGLEFPVVICVAGFKDKVPPMHLPKVYFYHEKEENQGGDSQNFKAKLSFSADAKAKMDEEEASEQQRLYYVAYTRASSLMILPFYENFKTFTDLKKNFVSFIKNKKFFKNDFSLNQKPNYKELNARVQEILAKKRDKDSESMSEENQRKNLKNLASEIPGLLLKKHSYSTLAHRKQDSQGEENDLSAESGGRPEKDGGSNSNQKDADKVFIKQFDAGGKQINSNQNETENLKPSVSRKDYPRGAKLGNAIHEIFEKIDFTEVNSLELKDFAEKIKPLVIKKFEKFSFKIEENDGEKDGKHWIWQTACIVWNTLRAKLPEIAGSCGEFSGKFFSLNEIPFTSRASEAEFNMNPETAAGDLLKRYCNGFIDLIFMRKVEVGGEEREVYSVLDWKTDTLKNENSDDGTEDYADSALLKNHTDENYSIQRVLYSYCLVKWLSENFGKSEEEIFKNHFGGIYYVYVRGCESGTSNGIYAHTWENWQDLESAFRKIRDELM